MLPVILSAQLNGGQSQPRNELMYQCRSLLTTTRSKWVCPHLDSALGQRNGGDLSLNGR